MPPPESPTAQRIAQRHGRNSDGELRRSKLAEHADLPRRSEAVVGMHRVLVAT